MTVAYVNTSPLALLGAHPRAVYRATLARTGLARVSLVSWPDAVRDTLEKAGEAGYGIALGGPLPGASDLSAVIELRAKTFPASGDSVGDLAASIDNASSYTELVRLERLPPIPAAGSPDATTRAATREEEAARAEKSEQSQTIGARLSSFGKTSAWVVGLGLAAGVVLVAAYLFKSPRVTIGKSAGVPGGSGVWE